MSSVVSIDCLWLSMTVDSTVLYKVAMKENLWNNCYHSPSQRGSYNLYLHISQTTAHKGHVLCFPNVVSIYSTDCIFLKKAKSTKYITIEEMGFGQQGPRHLIAIENVNLQNGWRTQIRYPLLSTVRLSLLIYDTTPPHPHHT